MPGVMRQATATVTKLPDAKPLKLAGCFAPQAKRSTGGTVWYFGTWLQFALRMRGARLQQ